MALASLHQDHPFGRLIDTLPNEKNEVRKYFNPQKLGDPKYERLPFSIRVLLEAAIRTCDDFYVKQEDVYSILNWEERQNEAEIPFSPARVLLQDFTGIPAMVDLAAMRDAVAKNGLDPNLINPKCPTDLIVDHSLQIDFSKCAIQNAPNPGGGDGQGPGPRSVPGRPAPRSHHSSSSSAQCGGQRGGCLKGSCTESPSRVTAVQIENTPLLCPFHLKPVSE